MKKILIIITVICIFLALAQRLFSEEYKGTQLRPPFNIPSRSLGFRPGRSSRNVGFRPVLTILPSGTSMVAGAVVSADRRYVRIGVGPMFSSVGNVETFTYAR